TGSSPPCCVAAAADTGSLSTLLCRSPARAAVPGTTVPKEMSMKNALLPACLLLLGLAACNKSSAAEKVIGTYELDKASTVTAAVEMAKKQDPKADVETVTKATEAMVGMMNPSMDVKADGTLVFRMAGTDYDGTWKHEGDTFTATTKKENNV